MANARSGLQGVLRLLVSCLIGLWAVKLALVAVGSYADLAHGRWQATWLGIWTGVGCAVQLLLGDRPSTFAVFWSLPTIAVTWYLYAVSPPTTMAHGAMGPGLFDGLVVCGGAFACLILAPFAMFSVWTRSSGWRRSGKTIA